MTKFHKIFVIILMIIGCQNSLVAYAKSETDISPNYPLINDYLNLARDELLTIPNYKVTMTLKDMNKNQVLMTSSIIGNQETGNQWVKAEVYTQEKASEEVKQYPIQILCYQNPHRIYINQIELLNHMNILEEKLNVAKYTEELEKYNDYISLIEYGSNEQIESIQPSLENLLLIPSNEQLIKLNSDYIVLNENVLNVEAHRIDIPIDFMKLQDGIHFNYKYNLDINHMYNSLGSYYDATSNATIDLKKQQNNIYWGINVLNLWKNPEDSKLNINIPFLDFDGTNKYEWSESFNSNDLTSKLTDIEMTMNPKNKEYKIILTGLVEQFDMNILEGKASKYGAAKYQLDIRLVATDEQVPNEGELNTITLEETDSIIEKILNENY